MTFCAADYDCATTVTPGWGVWGHPICYHKADSAMVAATTQLCSPGLAHHHSHSCRQATCFHKTVFGSWRAEDMKFTWRWEPLPSIWVLEEDDMGGVCSMGYKPLRCLAVFHRMLSLGWLEHLRWILHWFTSKLTHAIENTSVADKMWLTYWDLQEWYHYTLCS